MYIKFGQSGLISYSRTQDDLIQRVRHLENQLHSISEPSDSSSEDIQNNGHPLRPVEVGQTVDDDGVTVDIIATDMFNETHKISNIGYFGMILW